MGNKRNHVRHVLSEGARRLLEDCGASVAPVAEPVAAAPPMEEDPTVPMPCPYAAAGELMASGSTDEEVIQWVITLLEALGVAEGPETEAVDVLDNAGLGVEELTGLLGMET